MDKQTSEQNVPETNVEIITAEPNKLQEALFNSIHKRVQTMKESPDNYYVCDRINDIGYAYNFKESLFNYRDGFLLCERFYPEKVVKFDKQQVVEYDEESKEVYQEFLEYSKNIPNIKEIDNDQAEKIKNQIEVFQQKLNNANRPTREVDIAYFTNDQLASSGIVSGKIKLIPLKEQTDEYINVCCSITTDFIISFFQNIFMAPGNNGFAVRTIEYETYSDLVTSFIP